MRARAFAELLFFALLALFCWLLVGCASIPFERTYSLEYSEGEHAIGASVTLKPMEVRNAGDGKAILRR